MAFDYTEILLVADELITEFGRALALRRKVPSGTSTRACTGVEVEYRKNERDGQNIQWNDRRFLVKATGLALAPEAEEDQLVVDGVGLRVVTVTQLKPASLNLMWDLQVRQG